MGTKKETNARFAGICLFFKLVTRGNESSSPVCCRVLLEFLLNFNFLEGFDDVAFLDVVAVGQ